MDIKYVNPYSFISANYTAGMNSVAAALAPLYPNQTLDDLVDAVYTYVVGVYFTDPPNPLVAQNLKATTYSILNGYLNVKGGGYLTYNELQSRFIFQLLEGSTSCRNPEDIEQFILNVEEQITASSLTSTEQMPLLYATAIGKSAYAYWKGIITTPGDWANFIASFAGPVLKFPSWISSSMEGALIGLATVQPDKKDQLAADLIAILNYVGANILLSLFGTLSVGAGKVVFNLQARDIPCNSISMNSNCC